MSITTLMLALEAVVALVVVAVFVTAIRLARRSRRNATPCEGGGGDSEPHAADACDGDGD